MNQIWYTMVKHQMVFCPEKHAQPPLSKEKRKYVQQVVGGFLFYTRAIGMTIFLALIAITSNQVSLNQAIVKIVHRLLKYIATHPKTVIRYYASDIILNVHSDA